MKYRSLIAIFIVFSIKTIAFSQNNLGFESGLSGWSTSGSVAFENGNQKEGTKCIRIGSGFGEIYQNIKAVPLKILWFDAYIKVSSSSNSGYLFVRYFDKDSAFIMEQKSTSVTSISYQEIYFYAETPANTNYLQIGIESSSSNTGYVYGDAFSQVYFITDFEHVPQCDLDHFMEPFWSADTIFNETVLMYQEEGETGIYGKLLFTPKNIIDIKNFSQSKTYSQGTDFDCYGRTISKLVSSSMPYKKESELDFSNFNWNNLQSQWITVTYVPDRSDWNSPVPGYKGDKMPIVMHKLRNKQSLSIVALGMSITRGSNVSGYGGDNKVPACAPYMPGYIDLFAYQLGQKYGYHAITVHNASLPGKSSDWAAQYADKYVNPYHPDLVILDMGMNDFWSINEATFNLNIQAAINNIKADCPNAEFMLMSSILFDPEYLTSPDMVENYVKLMKGYNTSLQSMETTGIFSFDMTTLSDTIYNRKKPKDCLVNPLHPNDYLARWYAQGMFALLDTCEYNTANNSKEIVLYDYFNIYPNPVTNGYFTIDMAENVLNRFVDIYVFNPAGRQIASFKQNAGSNMYYISDLKMDRGLFFLTKVQGGKITVSKKIIIQQ